MSKRKKQSFLQGALVLMMGTLIVKVVSLLFKIPITNMLSEASMSYFENAYIFFTLFSTLAAAGFPVAISKMVADNTVLGRYRDNRKLLKLAITAFSITGIVCTLLMFVGAGAFSKLIQNPGAALSIMCLSPAVFFLCLTSAYRGYYQGLRNMYPTALSQVIEAVVKMLCGVGFTYAALRYTRNEFLTKGTVLGRAVESESAAELLIGQIGAGAALLGVVVSTAAGLLYLMLRHSISGDGIDRHALIASPEPEDGNVMFHSLMELAIPICLGSLALNLTSLIDMTTVMGRLTHVMEKGPEVVRQMYGSAIPADMADSLVPAHLYGAYTSIAVTISNIIPAVTTGFGISALPLVSNAWTRNNHREISQSISTVLRITALFCVPAGIGISMLSAPICRLFFDRPMGIAIAAPMLEVLGLASIFISMTTTLNSLLQAIGRASVPVRLVLVGGLIKLVLNFIFVGMPSINMKAVAVSTLVCYVVIASLSIYVIRQVARVKISLPSILWKPAIAGTACGFTAVFAYDAISLRWDSRFAVLPAVCLGGLVYAVGIFLLKAVKKEDILMLPKGEKVAKILEKCSLIG